MSYAIEGMLICAYAIGARQVWIYCRGEYKDVIVLLKEAIKQAVQKGICDGVDIREASGAGSYICGEETALIESLEDSWLRFPAALSLLPCSF